MDSEVDPMFLAYLKKQIADGKTVAQIRENLKNNSQWSGVDLDTALASVGANVAPPDTLSNKPTWGKVALGSFSSPEQMAFIHRVYTWMFIGLVVTGFIAYVVANVPQLIEVIVFNQLVFFGLLVAEFIAVFYLARMVHKISATIAAIVFLLYATLNGLTMSVIFLLFQVNSVGMVFIITAGLFAAMSLYGYITKRDLTTLGSFTMMALLGLVIAMFANLFLASDIIMFILAGIGVVIFVILTAYDTQKLKWMYEIGLTEGDDGEKKEAINGALTLYLDFVNLFLDLLIIFGKRK